MSGSLEPMRVCGSESAGGLVTHLSCFVLMSWQPPRWDASVICLLVPVSSGFLGGSDGVPGFPAASDHGGSDGDGELVGVPMHFEVRRRCMERPGKKCEAWQVPVISGFLSGSDGVPESSVATGRGGSGGIGELAGVPVYFEVKRKYMGGPEK